MKQLTRRVVIALLFLTAAAGCQMGAPGAPMADSYPVHGQVTFKDGTPLRGGVIYFTPVEVRTGIGKVRYEGNSLIDNKGNYTLGRNGDGTGVPTGVYKVSVQPRDYQELRGSNSDKIPSQYREASTTPLSVEVTSVDNVLNVRLD